MWLEVDGRSDGMTARVEPHPECETILLRFDGRVPRGDVRLSLRFRGRARDDLRGLYRSTDRDAPWLASQLCPTDARRLFPCFDEPGIKARYRLRVTAPRDQIVIANAPTEVREDIGADRRRWRFAPTPPLSVYLLAVAVGPFEHSRAVRVGRTPIRVITLPGRQRLGRFARRAAAESLARLERWFGLTHPYAKLDLVALPDFAFGAMENAGAVFFRDSALLLDEADARPEDRLRIAETVAHELAHMWFGNLVTMAWWNDLWLNESFATWMAYVIVDDWQPDWHIWHEFIDRRERALEVDALASSHPIAPRVRNADEAQENFDAITYAKGAAVLRMLERSLGARTFRDGVRRYVRRHREGAATAADLWAALAEVSGSPIEGIVSPWTLRTGLPLVSAALETRRGRARVRLRQTRFTARAAPGRQAQAERTGPWPIPWLGRHGGRPRDALRHLLQRASDTTGPLARRPEWLYANAHEAGFFRVDHGDPGFAALLRALPRLEALERIGWIGHEWALARSGRTPIARPLALIGALGDERDPDVLASVERVLAALSRRVADAEQAERLAEWVGDRFAPALEETGLAPRRGEDERARRRRARLVAILGERARRREVIDDSAARVRAHFDTGRPLPAGLAEPMLRIAAARNEAALQEALLAAVGRASTPQARRRFLLALAGFTAPARIRVGLRRALQPALAPAVDRAALLMAMLSERVTAEPTWRHLQHQWPRLERQLPPIQLARLAAATSAALPAGTAPEIRAFFRRHPLVAGSRVLRQVDEELTIAAALERRIPEQLDAFLDR